MLVCAVEVGSSGAAAEVSGSSRPVVVHLVHGTWPYGLFRRKPQGPPSAWTDRRSRIIRKLQLRSAPPRWRPAWFDTGSPVLARIRRLAGCPIEFRAFHWSGRNSVAGRHRSAQDFYRYLVAAAKETPDRPHVVLAHSHGGTVAATALSFFSGAHADAAPSIAAVICLSTPFSYLTYQERHDREEFSSAVGGVLLLAATLVLLARWEAFAAASGWVLLLFQFFGGILSQRIAEWIFARDWGGSYQTFGYHAIPASMPTFVLRGTRDEASLSIGLAQSIHALTNFIYASEDKASVSWTRKWLILLLLTPFTILLLKDYFSFESLGVDNMLRWVALAIVVGNGIAGLVRCGGFGVLALAIGYWDLRGWGCNSVEVDAVPPWKDCTVRSYFDMEPDSENPDVVRHGIYDHPEVQLEIAAIIRAAGAGELPRLRTSEELKEALHERRDRRQRAQRLREARAKPRKTRKKG